MLTIHHLQRGQSERIVWLCEELGIPYQLKNYKRDSQTYMSPPELQAIHPAKSAPVIQDGNVTLAESGAIVEYILAKYGNGKLSVSPDADNFADYLYFFHFANGTFQPAILRAMLMARSGISAEDRSAKLVRAGLDKSFGILEDRLSKNTWLAGDTFTAADIMVVFSLTTMRLFYPYSLEGHDGITMFLQRVSKREAYQRAMAKSDPGLEPLMSPAKPEPIWGSK